MNVSSTDPSTLFGGTWEQLKDRFLLGTGDTYTAGTTGGSATKTIAKANLPNYTLYSAAHTHTFTGTGASHSHGVSYNATGADGGNPSVSGTTGTTVTKYTGSAWLTPKGTNSNTTITVTSGGSGTALDVMNPYLAVYMWKRTA